MTTVGTWTPVGDTRHELGEGARATASGFVHVDLLAGVLYSYEDGAGEGRLDRTLALPVPLGAVAPRVDGGWIAAAGTGIAFVDDAGTEIEWLGRPLEDAAVPLRMNDGVADPHGRFWAGGMAYGDHPGTGLLVRVDRDGTVSTVLTGLTIPNGPAFSADGSVMYLADSARGLVAAYPVDDDGTLGPPTTFAEVDDASPDGMTVDAEGCLWVALWGGHRLHRYAPSGALDAVVPVPAAQPTSVALAAQGPGRVLVTTAAIGLAEPGPLDGATLVADVDVLGLPTQSFG